ncbi:hypothetical protein [Marinisporobacter balticus]|uniref:Uncharacterized protein n=1 Tax=Marinisporobacter balticus TaxID=2018667 RepID=A0A4V6NP80_9FIRM|nr:hypothetical protein [Marinisporobacter balticus]TCO69520.1 hypothetical protein EV214_13144 [Marinisporobacter balticus]
MRLTLKKGLCDKDYKLKDGIGLDPFKIAVNALGEYEDKNEEEAKKAIIGCGSRDNSNLEVLRNKGIGTNPPPNTPSPGAPGSRKSGMTIKVSVTDTKPFEQILDIIGQIMQDERIDKNIKQEYKNKITEIIR